MYTAGAPREWTREELVKLGRKEALTDIINHCQNMHDKADEPKKACLKCEYWVNTSGCLFYNRPLDWKLKTQN